MKIVIMVLITIGFTACHSYKNNFTRSNLIIGEWEQTHLIQRIGDKINSGDLNTDVGLRNIVIRFKDNGKYYFKYTESDYKYKQSGEYKYFPDLDSIVLYDYYPHAYTKESTNESWKIIKLSLDSLVVAPLDVPVFIDGDTLPSRNTVQEIYRRVK